MSIYLIEPDKISQVGVESLPRSLDFSNAFKVTIDKQEAYIVDYTDIFLASNEHSGCLNVPENRIYCAIRARKKLKGRTDPLHCETVRIGVNDWNELKLRKVGDGPNDLRFEDAEKTIGKLLYRVKKQSQRFGKSFIKWDLEASLDFEDFGGILRHFQELGYVEPYKEGTGRIREHEWTITNRGFEHFEQEIKEESKNKGVISRVFPSITSKAVELAIADAETLLNNSGATSGVDRIHTALHGHLIAVCDSIRIKYGKDPSLTELFKLLRTQHPALQSLGHRSQDISKVLNSLANIIDALNPLRNQASVAHPNPDLLAEEEALLVINTAKTLLHYLDAKFSK